MIIEIEPSYEYAEVVVSGADRADQNTAHVRLNRDRFVTVYISLLDSTDANSDSEATPEDVAQQETAPGGLTASPTVLRWNQRPL